MRRRLPFLLSLLLAACGSAAARPTLPSTAGVAAGRHVILVSVDGLMPASYMEADARKLRIPNLRRLVAEGRASPGVHPVFPTVTYPTHTTMVTGANPAKHGIMGNLAFDPLLRNQGGWNWYAEDIRVPTLWDVATDAGLRTAVINWPVSAGAHATWLVPEYWRAWNSDDPKITRALSTPGLLASVEQQFPELWKGFDTQAIADRWPTDIVVHLIESERPNLLVVHLWMVDETQHEYGPWSGAALVAIEEADAQVGRIVEAIEKAGIADSTLLMVVSDHGFAPVSQSFYPGVALRDAGLVTLDEAGNVVDWKAAPLCNAGQAYIYVKDPADEATRNAVRGLFAPLAGRPGSGIATVYGPDDIRARGGDPSAALALLGAAETTFACGYAGAELLRPSPTRGSHGFDPDDPAMRSSLILWGGGVAPGRVDDARAIDLGPTAAAWLGMTLPAADGRALPLR